MKMRFSVPFLVVALLGVAAKSRADVGFSLSVHDHWGGDRWDRHGYGPYYYNSPYYRRPWARPYRPVYVAPLVLSQPYYVPAPAAPAPVVNPSLTGDYGTDLANLHQKLYRLRAVLQKQNQKGQITTDQYNRFMNALDGIEHDAHARAFDRGGNLTQDDLAELDRRASQTGEDIEIALAL